MSSRPKLTGTLSRGIKKFTSKFRPGSPSSVRWYTNRLGHKVLDNRVPQKTIDKLNEIDQNLQRIMVDINTYNNEIEEITNLKKNYTLYRVIMNDPTRDFANRKQSLIKLLSNIDWETIISFFKTNISNPEYKNTIKLIYQFLMQLQTGEIISQVSGNDVEIELAKKLIGVSQRIQTATGKIKKSRKPKKPKKPKKHTLVKKKKRKKKSTIKN